MLQSIMKSVLRTHSRTLWTVAKGNTIGYIECVLTMGLVFPSDYISFRETSSNMSAGEAHSYSISHMPRAKRALLEQYMSTRTPVKINAHVCVFELPWNGDIVGGTFATDVVPLTDETVTVKTA